MYRLSMPDFVTQCNSHWENTGPVAYAEIPNADIFTYVITSYLLISLLISEKSQYWEVVNHIVVDQVF